MEEKIDQLIESYPQKAELLKKMKVSLLQLENDFVSQDFVVELESVLAEQDQKKLILLENMLRRMQVIKYETDLQAQPKTSYSIKIYLFLLLALCGLAVFMFFK